MTFKSRFSRCLNCLEPFTMADSTPKMADCGLREKGLLNTRVNGWATVISSGADFE